MEKHQKIAFLFPGQGAQYPGMGKDFAESFVEAQQTFEEADDLLKDNLSKTIFSGPEDVLTETKNSQRAIYVTSIAILRVLQKLFPTLQPAVCAGLSLGEYTALTAGGYLEFVEGLPLVQLRGQAMNDACEAHDGTMAVVLGLAAEDVETVVEKLELPYDLWIANFNCPGQVVISGTKKGIEAVTAPLKEKGAKRVLSLQVHGAFHSGLMKDAQNRLTAPINQLSLKESHVGLVMNVPGGFVEDLSQVRHYLIEQVSHSVRWEQGIKAMMQRGVDLFLEIGCGSTLTGMNKRIGVPALTLNIEKVKDLDTLEKELASE